MSWENLNNSSSHESDSSDKDSDKDKGKDGEGAREKRAAAAISFRLSEQAQQAPPAEAARTIAEAPKPFWKRLGGPFKEEEAPKDSASQREKEPEEADVQPDVEAADIEYLESEAQKREAVSEMVATREEAVETESHAAQSEEESSPHHAEITADQQFLAATGQGLEAADRAPASAPTAEHIIDTAYVGTMVDFEPLHSSVDPEAASENPPKEGEASSDTAEVAAVPTEQFTTYEHPASLVGHAEQEPPGGQEPPEDAHGYPQQAGGGGRFGGYAAPGGVPAWGYNQPPASPNHITTQTTEHVDEPVEQGRPGTGLLVAAAAFLLGRHFGRKKAEKRFNKIQTSLEKQIDTLKERFTAREMSVRQLAHRQAEQMAVPRPAMAAEFTPEQRVAPEVPVTHARHSVEHAPVAAAEALAAAAAARPIGSPERKVSQPEAARQIHEKVKAMNREEVLKIATETQVGLTNVGEVYKAHMISEEGMRRVVEAHLSGDIRKVHDELRYQLLLKEQSYERDPLLTKQLEEASEREPNTSSNEPLASAYPLMGESVGQTPPPIAPPILAAQSKPGSHTGRDTQSVLVAANVVALVILVVLLVILFIVRS